MTPPRLREPIRLGALITAPAAYRIPIFPILRKRYGIHTSLFYCREECSPGWSDLRHIHPYRVAPALRVGRWSLSFPPPRLFLAVLLKLYDCVLVSGWGHPFSLLLHVLCRLRGVPVVVLSDTGWPTARSGWRLALRRRIVRWVVRGCAAAVVSGKLAAEHLMQAGFRGPVFIGHYAVDVSLFAPAEKARTEEGLNLLFVGRLIGRKRLTDAISALALARSRGVPARLTVAGSGPALREAERKIAEAGIGESVRMLGAVAHGDLPALMRQMDALVVPSRHEPWGVVVAEAAASGLALLCSDETGAAADLLTEGEDGYEFSVGGTQALADAIQRLWRDKREGRLNAMATTSRRAAERFGFDRCAEQYARAIFFATGRGA
jgi:glycosyltransferase involved in cell wall biosynthesis